MRFQVYRGSNQKDRHVICHEDSFYEEVPTDVRQRGPWQVLYRGDIASLKPEYRLALARDGWVYIETNPVGFKASVI